jgi:hypothetical protein
MIGEWNTLLLQPSIPKIHYPVILNRYSSTGYAGENRNGYTDRGEKTINVPSRKAPWDMEDRHERLEKSSTCKIGLQVPCCCFTDPPKKYKNGKSVLDIFSQMIIFYKYNNLSIISSIYIDFAVFMSVFYSLK